MLKEFRKPKSEKLYCFGDMSKRDATFLNWGNELSDQVLVLRDEQPRDLMERTAEFGELIIRFSKTIPHTPENIRLISQLVGAGTSIGANYCEADHSVSGKDFKKSIGDMSKRIERNDVFSAHGGCLGAGFEGRSPEALA